MLELVIPTVSSPTSLDSCVVFPWKSPLLAVVSSGSEGCFYPKKFSWYLILNYRNYLPHSVVYFVIEMSRYLRFINTVPSSNFWHKRYSSSKTLDTISMNLQPCEKSVLEITKCDETLTALWTKLCQQYKMFQEKLLTHCPWKIWLQSQISKFQTHFNDKYLKYFLWNWYQVNVTVPYWLLVNIGSGNGLVPSGNKPLPEPVLT